MNKFLLPVFCLLANLLNEAKGATITAVANGGWYTNSTWSCNCQPANTDNVVIPAGITVSITAGPVILTGGPSISVTILGTLSLISGGTLIVDSNDMVKVLTGGKITGTGILDAVWSGGTPIWVPNGTTINGPSAITGGSLPVKLLYFKAEVMNLSVSLRWASATEVDLDHYTVERSTDGIHFAAIGQKPGAGNSTRRIEYIFEDDQPVSGKAYYRLVSVDVDSMVSLSDVVNAEWEGVATEALTIYPNPVVDRTLHATVNLSGNESGMLALYDGQGRMFAQQNILSDEKNYTLELPPSAGRGIYFLVVQTGARLVKKSLVVSH